LEPAADACAAVAAQHIRVPYDDITGLQALAEDADCISFEFENVPVASLDYLVDHAPVFPSPKALATARDRLVEKNLFRELGIPTAEFRAVDSRADLDAAVKMLGLPAVLKTRTLGYDGKGQAVLRDAADVAAAWAKLGGVPLILEAFVSFTREVSVIAVRARDDETAFYPLSENTHRGGILHLSLSCAHDRMQASAQDYANRLLRALDYVGVLALELFEADGKLLANEFAPRVHNSGHWTIEGAETSQFENHVRAVLGLPLGRTAALGCAAMVNFIGRLPPRDAVLRLPAAHFHDYGKQPRAGRKVGHATLRTADMDSLRAALPELLALAERDVL
ncbi:MAG: 5-(carboxyamino)imidazole ribonucleotide synthase, partial [Pseudomonadota bacterium]